MNKRVKSKASPVAVPQSRDEVNDAIAQMGIAQRERARIEASMNDQLAAIKKQFEELAAPHKERIEALAAGIQTWCEANRKALTNDGKVKFATFTSGEVKWRIRPPSVAIRGAESLIQVLKNMGLTRFVRTKEEINKEQMLAEPEVVKNLAGVTITQGEDFAVEPYEAKLVEVA